MSTILLGLILQQSYAYGSLTCELENFVYGHYNLCDRYELMMELQSDH